MAGVLLGYAIIFSVIGIGYVLARAGVIGAGNERLVLNKVAFYAATPALLFTVVGKAQPGEIFTPVLAVAALSAVATAAVYIACNTMLFHRPVPEAAVGAAASSYVNSNNIGLPVGIYVLGTAAYVPPILVLQLVVFTPVILFAIVRGGIARALRGALLSPIVLGSVLGLVVSIFRISVPEVIMEPLSILGGASIPMILLSFGASLHSGAMLDDPDTRAAALLAAVLKVAGMPAIAWIIAMMFGLSGEHLYAAVILAALPTAQNVYNYAATHRAGETIARDTVLVSTFASLPAMLLVSWFLGAGVAS